MAGKWAAGLCVSTVPTCSRRSFAALRRSFPAAELCIMGSDYGPGGMAETWATSEGLTQGVHFLGSQPYPKLLAKLADSDLLLHPSLEETFGMSIAEAMSLGLPVVGGQASGAVPWVIGEGGVVVDVTSVKEIESALVGLLSDLPAYQRCTQAARKRAQENFAVDQVADAYEATYSNAIRHIGTTGRILANAVMPGIRKI
ncbi:MAG: hypothetical protein B7Z35_14625 [Hydrogenophilales bacterium 12-61-10]|nr:MAG: hypothetical protein B7Z35_14625 [Hydrogenophilales bacterium 12-61-10]